MSRNNGCMQIFGFLFFFLSLDMYCTGHVLMYCTLASLLYCKEHMASFKEAEDSLMDDNVKVSLGLPQLHLGLFELHLLQRCSRVVSIMQCHSK